VGQTWESEAAVVLVVDSQTPERGRHVSHTFVFLTFPRHPEFVGEQDTVNETSDRPWDEMGPGWKRLT
jgi:hypothetical protein